MKFFTLFIAALVFQIAARATIWPVSVVNNQFIPATINVQVGDTVRYNFTGTFPHNVTTVIAAPRAGAVPAGAPDINSGPVSNVVPRSYDYKVVVAGNYRYYCIQHSADGINGMIGFIVASAPLPATLKGFTAKYDREAVAINWQTLTESNVAYFTISRSYNGHEFTDLTKVQAVGNSTSLQSYSFSDNHLSKENTYIYYSLATVDKDGKKSLSPIVQVHNTQAVKKLITSLSPNPVPRPGHLMLQFNADGAGKLLVAVYNTAGKKVLADEMNAVAGLNNGHLHVGDLQPGIYNIVFSMGKMKETYRVVVE